MSIPQSHSFPFDPTYGYSLERLQQVGVPEAPEGFDVFWRQKYDAALAVPVQVERKPSKLSDPRWTVEEVRYVSTDGVRIGAWLLTPKNRPIRQGIVVGHGYGGRDGPDFDFPGTDAVLLFPCARGMSLSAQPPFPSMSVWHVLHQIEEPEKYLIGGCVQDIWVSVSVLSVLHPDIADRIGYSGISFGGGLGALAIPFDRRVRRGFLEVPTFGNRPLWLQLPTTGSAASVQIYAKTHPGVGEKLRLFDAATAASRITVPMLVAAAQFDPAVAPPCQFAVANALPRNQFNQIFILDAGHFEYPGEQMQHAALSDRVRQFFGVP
ncbi:acetylxylan esterase [Rhizobium oryzicola]|uniref:Acetylxylan esterase n=1 Tax=Rhizobium oryzicola TaxID=1232668 RepID=A0ABT8SV27_9HYPH|nr:acetylxylan esterase [Rhizobium oryzicola]MDO1582295.1 acetylxylan esterase [Rhizobium oryzicola]